MSSRRILIKMLPLAGLPALTRSQASSGSTPAHDVVHNDTHGDSSRIFHSAPEPGASRRVLSSKLSEGPAAIEDFGSLSSALTAAGARRSLLSATGKMYRLTGTLLLDGKGETVAGLHGYGAGRTVLEQGGSDAPGIAATGRFMSLEAFEVRAPFARGTSVEGANVLLTGTFTFSSVRNVWLTGGYYGIVAKGLGHDQQFNNTFDNVRVSNWERAAWSYGGGSGSLYLNHYASAIERDAVDRALECSNHSGEFIRLNIERCTIRGCMAHLPYADQLTFHGVNTEQVSLIGGDSSTAPSFFFWSGRGTTRVTQWWMDSCHVGGYIVKELSCAGSIVTAKLELLGFQQKQASGSGIRPGDSIYVDGAAESGFNGAHIVTQAAGALVSFEIRGLPPSSATVEPGADCIVMSLGERPQQSVPLVHLSGNAGTFIVDSLHIRDMRVIGKNADKRASLLRLARFDGAGRAYFRHLTFGGQTSSGTHWLEPAAVTGYSRRAGMATVYFSRPHNLRVSAILHFFEMQEASLNGRTSGRLWPVSPFAVSFASAGPDLPLTGGGGRAIVQTHTAVGASCFAGLATIITSGDHGLAPGMMFAGQFADSAFDTPNALVLSVPTKSSFTYRRDGPDRVTRGGVLMVIEGGLAWGDLEDGTSMTGLMEAGELDQYCAIFAAGAVAAGAVATTVLRVQRAIPGRDGIQVTPIGADPRMVISAEVVGPRDVQLRALNASGSTLNAGACEVRVRIATA